MYHFDIDPVPKPRMTQRDRWAQRPTVLRYFSYCQKLGAQNLIQKYHPAWSVDVRFTMPMPKTWSKKKREKMNGVAHQQKPDIDNLLKAFMDALMVEDKEIYEVHASKFWGDKGAIDAK